MVTHSSYLNFRLAILLIFAFPSLESLAVEFKANLKAGEVTPENFYPEIASQLKRVPYKSQCKIPANRKEIRLDLPGNSVGPNIYDQGNVGACTASAAIVGIESVFRKNNKPVPSISPLSSALQAKLTEYETLSLNVESEKDQGKLRPLSKEERAQKLGKFFPLEWLNFLPESDLNALLVTTLTQEDLLDRNQTSVHGMDICQIVNQLNKEGYCERGANQIEKQILKSREPSEVYEDRGGLQGKLLNAVESMYLGLQLIRVASLASSNASLKLHSQKLLDHWKLVLKSFSESPGIQSKHIVTSQDCPDCSYLNKPQSSIEAAFQEIKSLATQSQLKALLKQMTLSLSSSTQETLSLKPFMMSVLLPECDEPSEKKYLKPPLKCTTKPFPSLNEILRREEESKRLRKEFAEKYLGETLYDTANKHIATNPINLKSMCKNARINEWSTLCIQNSEGEWKLKPREVFISEGLSKIESHKRTLDDWLAPSEVGAMTFGKNTKEIGQFGELSERILNIGEVANEFDQIAMEQLSSGLPLGASICAGVLEKPNFDGRRGRDLCMNAEGQKSSSHAVQIIGVRKSSIGCEYLVKDSRGPDMNYLDRCKNMDPNSKLPQPCEPGLIWVPSEDISANTLSTYKIN